MQCVKCGYEGDVKQFLNFYGKQSKYCEKCRKSARDSMKRIKTKEERTEAHRKWRKENTAYQQYMFEYNLKKSTGLTLEQYQILLDKQQGKCAICNQASESKRFTRLHVDHNHDNGEIRGLLCSSCNTAIGLLKEDPQVLRNCIEYLKRGGQLTVDGKVQK